MSKRSKKPEPKFSNLFVCHEHEDLEPMDFTAFKVHLVSKHDIRPGNLKGTKQMTMHIDGTDSFTSVYEVTLESGLKFTQTVWQERDADDMMRYA